MKKELLLDIIIQIQFIKIKRSDRTISYVSIGLAPEVNLISIL
jgi:hypothetical protein